jgi:hypothetical protein
MWPDNETAEDLLGFQVHSDLIWSVVTNPKMLPVTIGVFGDWGGGKTSIMKMLERDLTPDNWSPTTPVRKTCESIAVVYLNTWLFEGYDDAKSAILSAVLLQLGEHQRFGPRMRSKVVSLLKSVNVMRLARFGFKHVALPATAAFVTAGTGAVPLAVAASLGFNALAEKFNPQNQAASLQSQSSGQKSSEKEKTSDPEKIDWGELIEKDATPVDPLDVRAFRERFAKMLADSDIKTLVVLIDDLDRCTPERIIESLEAIKLFLNVEGTAFVIGADPRIVQHAIRSRYAQQAVGSADKPEDDRLVKDYLEKVIQIPYRLPRLSSSEIETYMVLLFSKHYLGHEDIQRCLKACNEERIRNRYSVFGYASVRQALNGAELKPELSTALTFCAAAAPLIADGLKGNPRQVKRFLNALLLRKDLANIAKLQNIRDDVLVKLMILEYVHEELFLELFEWQSQQEGHPAKLAELEEALAGPTGHVANEDAARKIDPKWATSSVRKWIAMEPMLSRVDLRDYFWIARDRLESTFSGISMVPPIVRAVLDELLSGNNPKRNAALKSAGTLREDERVALLGLIDQRISRQPEEKIGYDALRLLTENGISGAVELLGRILETRPAEKMPPGVGMDLGTLIKTKQHLASTLKPAIDRLQESQTKIGAAVRNALGVSAKR